MGKKMGRPLRSDVAADERVSIRLTAAEKRAWQAAAGDASLVEWIRETCNERVKRSPR